MHHHHYGGGGRGHRGGANPHPSHSGNPRRELRRPHGQHGDDLAQRMAGMDPFGGGGGNNYGYNHPAQPAPSVDGWSSGGDGFEQFQQQQQQFGGGGGYQNNHGNHHQQHHHHQRQQQHYQQQRGGGNDFYNSHDQYQFGGGGGGGGGGAAFQQYQQQQGFLNAQANEFVPKSNLSANAVEFVPPAMARNTSQWGAAFTPAAYPGHEQHGMGGAMHQDMGGKWEVHPMERLTDAIATLVYSPGKIDRIAAEQTETLNASIGDVETLQRVVNTIFDSCFSESSFRSCGARLLASLSGTVNADFAGETFRSTVLKKCESEKSVKSDPSRTRTFVLFLAELFVHLKEPTAQKSGEEKKDGGDEEGAAAAGTSETRRVPSLADSLMEYLSTLSNEQNRGDNANLTTVADALKMAGGPLEMEEKSRSSDSSCPKLDSLLATVNDLSSSSAVSSKAKEQLAKIAELRKEGWPEQKPSAESQKGVSTRSKVVIEPAPPEPKPAPAPAKTTNNAAKGSNGGGSDRPSTSRLTNEEIQFMNEHLGDAAGFTTDDFNSDLDSLAASEATDNEDGMPPEIAAAFEEFIANQD